MSVTDKPLVWIKGDLKTPPLSREARILAGVLLRLLQKGEKLSMPHSRPMTSIGKRCHELRVQDGDKTWRVVYRIDSDRILILEVFSKKSRTTPKHVLDMCKRRLRDHDNLVNG